MAIDRSTDNGDPTAPRPTPTPSQQTPVPNNPLFGPGRDPTLSPRVGASYGANTPGINYGAGNRARYEMHDPSREYGRYDATELGGYKGGANDIAGALSRQGASYQGRAGTQINDPFAAANRGLGMEARGAQGDALGLMRAAALGQQPSAAQIQMGQGIDAALASQMAAANSARGGGANIALAQRNAASQGSAMQTAGINQAAALRAQEMAQARGAYSEAAQQQRAQDLQLSGMDAQTAFQQAQLEAQQRAQNDAMQRAYEGMGMDAQTAQLNANMQQYGADRGVGIAAANRESQDQKDWTAAGIGALGTLAMFSDVRAKTSIEPAGDGGYGLAGEAVTHRAEGATGGTPWAVNMSPGIQGPVAPRGPVTPRGDSMALAAPPSAPTSAPTSIQATSPTPGASPVSAVQPDQGMGLLGASQTLGGYYSDERTKGGATSHPSEADAFLDTLKPYSYAYKDGAHEPTDTPTGGRYLGIMAQNVERGPTGHTLVKDTPNGKAIEGGAMLSALAAGEGRLHERINRIDAILARKGGR